MRPRILIVSPDSSQDDHKAVLDGIGTALTAADRGRVERISARHFCVGTAGPFVRLRGEADLTISADDDHAAFMLDCLDRPVGNEAVMRAVQQALRAMAGTIDLVSTGIMVESPTPWQRTAVTFSEDPMSRSVWPNVTMRNGRLDPDMEALLPDVVVAGGTLTEMTLSPLGWTGMRSRMLDPMGTLRAISELRSLMDRMDGMVAAAAARRSEK